MNRAQPAQQRFQSASESLRRLWADVGGLQFSRRVAIFMASVTVFIAMVTYLEIDARTKAEETSAQAQIAAIEAMGMKIRGEAQVRYDWEGAYRVWSELDLQRKEATKAGDTEAAFRYEQLRNDIIPLSDLLSDKYFNPSSGNAPDLNRYQTDVYIEETTALSERYDVAANLKAAWSNKANRYVAHIALLAVTLFLFGLALTTPARAKFFLGAGVVIAIGTMTWAAVVLLDGLPGRADAAIKKYALGAGLASQGKNQEAIDAYGVALSIDRGYGNAYVARGDASRKMGYDKLGLDPEAALPLLKAAVDDYKAAQEAGRDDAGVAWDLGWAYYLRGDFDDAVRTDSRALQLNPDLFAVDSNLALALLAGGHAADGKVEFERAMERATTLISAARASGGEAPASSWSLLDAIARDLDSLADRLDGTPHEWTQAPIADMVVDPTGVRMTVEDLRREVKELTLSLEVSGKAPGRKPAVVLKAFDFARRIDDRDGNFVRYDRTQSFPRGTTQVHVLYEYEGIKTGQQVVWKVYYNGSEARLLRHACSWNGRDCGSGDFKFGYAFGNIYSFNSGYYSVELYVDSHLLKSGSFTVEN